MFADLTTAQLADACVRVHEPVRAVALRPVIIGMRLEGPVRPVRHYGSVDVFLEAFEASSPGEVAVIDNEGRTDEACVGDLIALEAKMAGLAGIVIWGLHRDSREIVEVSLPVFSLGPLAAGPQRLDARLQETFSSARVGAYAVTAGDYVVADDDGAIFLPRAKLSEIATAAKAIRDIEARQAQIMASGASLRAQTAFGSYMKRRSVDPTYTFRAHLRDLNAAIEE